MSHLVELGSGVDSLYVSARCVLPADRLDDLERQRDAARSAGAPVSYLFGGYDFQLKLGPLNNHRYRLDPEITSIGLSPSEHLPPLYVQFRSEAIRSAGVHGALRWPQTVLSNEDLDAHLQVSRLDLHADFQGWSLVGDQRHRFVCRSRSLATYEEGASLSGFSFGNRKSKTVVARIYDKTSEIAGNGRDWWHEVWTTVVHP